MPGPVSTSALAAAISACDSKEQALALLDRFVDECGAKYGVLYSFDYGVMSAADRWSPIYMNFPNEICDYYERRRCVATDPFVRIALSKPAPVTFQEEFHNFQPCEATAGLHALFAAYGLRDGIAMHVSRRPGRMMYFNLAYDRSLRTMSEFERRRIHACIEMFASHCEDLLAPEPARELSPKEREVILYLARGDSNKQIARTLGVSLSTVNTLVKRAFKKLDANTRVEAAIAASRTGLALVA